ncbi:MAG: helix-turn-helix transcriptional regulator [Desulfuromusa sp.]|nr:helix-turn-helix transcriptional regulator [Desulfuromusa sp.]
MKPNKIRALMVERGIKQADIARDLNIRKASVNGVVHGKWASRRVATEVARRLNLPLEKVFPKYAA